MIERFTAAEEAQILEWANERNGFHTPQGDRRVSDKMDSLTCNVFGIKGEYAVHRGLRVGTWHRFSETGGDGGVDITANGWTIQIKTNTHRHGDFYLQFPDLLADVGILVVPVASEPAAINVCAWISRRGFERRAMLTCYDKYRVPQIWNYAVGQYLLADNIIDLYHMIQSTPR